jgi:hypothetical protein
VNRKLFNIRLGKSGSVKTLHKTHTSNNFSPAAFKTLKSTVPDHFTTLCKSRSTSSPSGQLAREAAEYSYSVRAESVAPGTSYNSRLHMAFRSLRRHLIALERYLSVIGQSANLYLGICVLYNYYHPCCRVE